MLVHAPSCGGGAEGPSEGGCGVSAHDDFYSESATVVSVRLWNFKDGGS